MPISRLSPLLTLPLEPRPLPSPGVTRLQRYYEPLRLLPQPGLSLAGVRLGHAPTAGCLPCCARSPCTDMPSPLPRRDRCWVRVAPRLATTAAFPKLSLGRLPHFVLFEACSAFTHVRACRLAESLIRSFPSKASAASLPPLPLRLLLAEATVARWELHPLKNGAFARRTTMGTTLLSSSARTAQSRRSQGDASRNHGPADGHALQIVPI